MTAANDVTEPPAGPAIAQDAAELERQREQLALAEQMAGVGHWRIDLAAGTLYWSDEIFRIHGVTRESYTPTLESAIDFYHPDDVDKVRAAVDAAIGDKRPFEFEFRIVRPAGDVRTVRSKGRVGLDDSGQVSSVFGIFQDITEQRLAERDLRESKERYDLAVRASSVGLWDWNLRTNSLYWSPRFMEIVGVDANCFEPELSEFESRLHPADHDRVMGEVNAHLTEGVPFDSVYKLRCEDGRYVWIHARGQAVWDAAGVPTRMTGSVDDISERKRDEMMRNLISQLLSSQDMDSGEKLQELLRIGLDYFDLDAGVISRVDDARYLAEFVEDPAAELVRGAVFPLADTYCVETLRSGDLVAFGDIGASSERATPYYRLFGFETYVGAPLRVNGELYGTLALHGKNSRAEALHPRERSFLRLVAQWIEYEIGARESVDALLQSREALRRQQHDLDLIFNNVPVRIWFKDDENRILRLNAQAADSMGVTVAEAEGANAYDLFPEIAAKYHKDDLEVLKAGEPRLNIVEPYMPRDGERGWVRTDKVPFIDEHTGTRHVLVLAQDVTKLMRQQQQLKAQAEELLRSNRDLDQFAYIASHDLRAPMRGINNLATWIEEDLADTATDEIREKLELMRTRILRMDRMLEDVLSYSRAGRKETEPERVDSAALVNELAEWAEIPGEFVVDVDDALPALRVSRTALEQVLSNLLLNAVKHHDRDSGRIAVSCAHGQRTVTLSVTDDGPGIPAQFHERVLTMFQTLNRRDEVEGSGIGLAIVHKIVNLLGGELIIHSPVVDDRGTRFDVSLPRRLLMD